MTETEIQTIEESLRIARVALVRKMPYLAGAVLRTVLIPAPSIPTMGIDDRLRIYYNPEFAARQSPYDLVALFFHEIFHWLREHTGERGSSLQQILLQDLVHSKGLSEEEARVAAPRLANLAYDLESFKPS